MLLPAIAAALARTGEVTSGDGQCEVTVTDPGGTFTEEERSRRPSVFSALREIIADLAGPDPNLGLYGAFGYDLAFQFEPVRPRIRREAGPAGPGPAPARPGVGAGPQAGDGGVLLLRLRDAGRIDPAAWPGRPRPGESGAADNIYPKQEVVHAHGLPDDPVPGAYAQVVAQARERFACGDLFEVVPSHVFHAPCASPAAFFERLRQRNPAPYEFFLNLGAGEYLVGASPEMYVRVTGDRVETCPIAGTIARGEDPLGDADAIRALLASPKEESELTMCTDVDRNDKSRICVPGSIKVIGRRQIELYSRLIHTVDHIEGRLRPEFDALDAFLTHMWAVTVTGAPKAWAMQFIEDHEADQRRWYGGAVGMIGFDGGMNTGLTLRTAHIRDGVAAVRTGATLLFDSDPEAEEQETRLKARALLETLAEAGRPDAATAGPAAAAGAGAAGWPGGRPAGGRARGAAGRLPGLVRAHAGGLLPRAGRRGDDAAGRVRPGAARPVRARPGGAVAGAGAARRLRLRQAARPRSTSAELPVFGVCLGLQAHGRARGRHAGPAGDAGARQAGPGPGAGRRRCWPGCRRSSRRAATTRCTPGRSRSPAASRSPRSPRTGW